MPCVTKCGILLTRDFKALATIDARSAVAAARMACEAADMASIESVTLFLPSLCINVGNMSQSYTLQIGINEGIFRIIKKT